VTIVRIKGFKIFQDRQGRWRCYHRQTGVAIKAPIGSAEFLAECAAIIAKNVAKPAPGTLGLLIADYRASEVFSDLAPRTRTDYQRIFDYLHVIDGTILTHFNRPLVVKIRDKAAASKGRRFGNYVKAVLSILFKWGCERGYLADNPATAISNMRRPKGLPKANRPWSDQERHVVLEAASPSLRPAIALMMFTGLGPKDALALPSNCVRDGEISTRRSKTGEPVFWPLPKPLAAVLDQAPRHFAMTLCAHSGGLTWSQGGFGESWSYLRRRLEREGLIGPGLTLYGLRHTVAVILREIGYDERTIADALGQKTTAMARHYADGADLKRKMRGVVKNFDAELARRGDGK
jgi:integrase